jgi:threonine dehydratase
MTIELISTGDVDDAAARISGHVARTPLLQSSGLSALLGADVTCKPELFQPSGSFKVRGAFNTALTLSEEQKARGLFAFSAGNHAMAVAHVARQLELPVTVCMPAGAVQFKVDAVRNMGARVELVDGDLVGFALELCEKLGSTLIHPFDDPRIVAATATIGREIIADGGPIDTVIVPVGGGGLISGTATGVRMSSPTTRVIGVEPEASDVVTQSRAAGQPVSLSRSSIADGLAAPITGAINLLHIEEYVDEIVRVSEDELADAWRKTIDHGKFAIEPAAGAGVAAVLSGRITLRPEERVTLVLSGGNADFGKLP